MIRAIIAVVQGAIAGMIGMFIVDRSVDVATDERTHNAGRRPTDHHRSHVGRY